MSQYGVHDFNPTEMDMSHNIHHIHTCTQCMGRVAVTDGMPLTAVERLQDAGHEVVLQHFSPEELLSGALSDFDAVVIRSSTKMDSESIHASKTKSGGIGFIGRAGVGVDNIDLAAAADCGIVVCNTPGASTRSVVELTIGHLIASARHIPKADRTLRSGEWAKKSLRGSELRGKRLGMVGFGRIARGVGEVASALGMELHAFDPYISSDVAESSHCTLHDEVDELFRICTHISIHCNLSKETYHLVNSDRLALMGGVGADGAQCGNHIINCARGGIVDEASVLSALESGQLSSAALDVFEIEPPDKNSLLAHDNFHGSPHIGAATLEAQNRVGEEMAELLVDYFSGKIPSSAIN